MCLMFSFLCLQLFLFENDEYIFWNFRKKCHVYQANTNTDNSARDTCLHVVVTEVAELLCC